MNFFSEKIIIELKLLNGIYLVLLIYCYKFKKKKKIKQGIIFTWNWIPAYS